MEDQEGSERSGPLTGVRVVDLSHVLNGPFCTMFLAHMGADVIKIEKAPGGDRFRHAWMPIDADHDGYEFMVVNANKRSLTLDLKAERGREVLRDLVACSDVVVENFSLGVMERLGLGYDDLRKINPGIVYASARGYGEDGPRAPIRANASTILAATGWTARAWDFSGAPGTKTLGIGDEAAGVSLALGVLAALVARQATGVGQRVDVSMQEALLGFMVSTFHTFFEGQPVGRELTPCADGYVAFHSPDMSDELWKRFAEAMGHPEAVTDPKFATVASRRENFEELEAVVLRQWVASKTRAEMWKVFEQTHTSAAPVVTLGEVLEDEHLAARGAFVDIDDPRSGPLKLLKPWIRFSEMPTEIRHAGRAVGEDSRDVLSTVLGLSEAEIDDLERDGVI